MLVNIIVWLVFGGLAGWLAGFITGAKDGIVTNIIVGIIGAFLGGFLMSLLGQGGVSGFNIYSLIVAIIGAIVLTLILRAFNRSR